MPGRMKEKARRTVKVRQSGASWRDGKGRALGRGKHSCGLLCSKRARDTYRPFDAIGPILRQVQHGLFEGTSSHVAVAIGDTIKCGPSVQNNRRQALTANAASLRKDIGDRYELFS